MSALERILEEFSAQEAPAGASAPRARSRQAAAQALRAHALPTRGEENWRYANLRVLEGVRRFAPGAAYAPGATLPALPAALPGYLRLVFIDGKLHSGWPTAPGAPLMALPEALALAVEAAAAPFETAGDGRLGLIARMFAPEPLALQVTGALALEVISLGSAAAIGVYTEITLVLDAGARVELVERHLSEAAPAILSCSNLRLRLGAGAQLRHTRLLQTGGHALHYDTVTATLAERAGYRLCQVAAGGGSARSSTQVRLQGRDAVLELRALAAARDIQVADALFTVLHEAPGTRSEQLFRGIASERAHVACSADVQVAPAARGSQVRQSLRGLIDGKGAELDLRPRLTINTEEIRATHGATTGRLDEELLFYLLARGLEPAAARSLLKWAFLGEMLSTVEPPALRREAELAAAARLSDAPAAELLQ